MKKFTLVSIIILIFFGIVFYQSPALQTRIYSLLPANVSNKIDNLSPQILKQKTKPLYKWKNKKGQWIIRDTPPESNIPYDTLQYNQNANVIPSSPQQKK